MHRSQGSATKKYGTMHMDKNWNFLYELLGRGIKMEELVCACVPYKVYCVEHGFWAAHMYILLHEFTHTVEQGFVWTKELTITYHDAIYLYFGQTTSTICPYEYTRLFLSNLAYVDGQRAGIPYEFWLRANVDFCMWA
jgi:hypothetical protein